jgi:hypothetical protein
VHAFDINPLAQEACRQITAINGVSERVLVRAEFNPEILKEMEGSDTLILCDAEGAEAELIDPLAYPSIRAVSALIVECHETKRPGVTDQLSRAFVPTHQVQLVRHEFSAPAAGHAGDGPAVPALAPSRGREFGESVRSFARWRRRKLRSGSPRSLPNRVGASVCSIISPRRTRTPATKLGSLSQLSNAGLAR